jgi:hypothetical protein
MAHRNSVIMNRVLRECGLALSLSDLLCDADTRYVPSSPWFTKLGDYRGFCPVNHFQREAATRRCHAFA